jgi:hypothetical protein
MKVRRAMAELLRLAPAMRLSNVPSDTLARLRRTDDAARYIDGLRLAGMPESSQAGFLEADFGGR